MSDGIKTALIIAACVVGFILFAVLVTSDVDSRCKEQFGQDWTGQYDGYGPDFCVNDKGEAKYPR